MDWDSYYEKFYDWATSTQIKKMSSLTSFGASAEVSEVAQEYMDEKAASQMKSMTFPAAAIYQP